MQNFKIEHTQLSSRSKPAEAPAAVTEEGVQLGRRLRERDLSAAPAALNLLESSTLSDREQAAALLREVSPAALGGEAAGAHRRRDRTAGRGQVDAAVGAAARLARTRAHGGDARGGPELKRSGGSLLGDRARIEFDPADGGVLIRSTAAGDRLGGLAPATRAAAQALAAAFDVVVIETVGVGQAETEVADVADTVAVVVQPGSGDVLQFLKSGIMETPDVLVVTKADLGQLALATRRDLSAALRSLGARETKVVAVSSLPPTDGIDGLIAALDEHRERVDVAARRTRARRSGALLDFAAEHGGRGLRALGGRRGAERLLEETDPNLDEQALVAALEQAAENGDDGNKGPQDGTERPRDAADGGPVGEKGPRDGAERPRDGEARL